MTDSEAEPTRAGPFFKDDDHDAFEEFFRAHSDRLSRVAYLMLHDQPAAEDAVQEAFARAWEKRGDFRGSADPLTWLYSILLNVCRMALRKSRTGARGADSVVLDGARSVSRAARGVFTSVVRREVKRQLVLAMGWLGESQREVFVLHYIEGLPFDRIARMLDLKPSTARSFGHRARAVLMEKMPRLAREFAKTED